MDRVDRIMNLKILFSFLMFLFLFQMFPVSATVTSVKIEMYPLEGDITTDIFVQVRGTPYGDHAFLYLYYDDKMIVQRMECLAKHDPWGVVPQGQSWDIHLKVPNSYPYSELGNHIITARIESGNVKMETSTTFKVVNYIPPPEWWENLPEDFIEDITGPQGPKGNTGKTGEQGIQGNIGIKGEIGEQGIQGNIGDTPYKEIYLVSGISAIAIILSLISLWKINKFKAHVYSECEEKI